METFDHPITHCQDCKMTTCPTCFTTECECSGCTVFQEWLNQDKNNKNFLSKRPFNDEDREFVSNRQWTNREIWLLTDGLQAIEEGCNPDPWYAGQWAERERIGEELVKRLCKNGKECIDPECGFIMEILEKVVG